MKRMQLFIFLAFFGLLGLTTLQCGGSSDSGEADDDGDEEADTSEADGSDVAVAGAANTGIAGGATNAAGTAAPNLAALLKSAVTRQMTQTIDETQTMDCSSGTLTLDIDGTMTLSSQTDFTLSITSVMTADNCAESSSITLEDGSTCGFTGVMDGSVTCTITGNQTTMSFSCSTAAACSGLNVTLNGDEHTGGVSFTASMSTSAAQGGTQPEFDGTVCIDGDSFTLGDLLELQAEAPQGGLTCSE